VTPTSRQKSNLSMLAFVITSGVPSSTSSPRTSIDPSRPAWIDVVRAWMASCAASAAA
jgi:hypothetical protein